MLADHVEGDTRMRRSIVASLAAGLVLATVAGPAAGQAAGFDDVPPDNVHADNIARAVELELVQGTGPATFRPERSLTRGQAATVLLRALEALDVTVPPLAGAPRFSDTGAPHEDAIRRLAAADVVRGRDDGSFEPEAPVRRDQLASLAVRAVEFALDTELAAEDGRPFDDVQGGVHADAVAVAAELGIVLGKGDRRFDPRGETRRDQAASVAVRFFDLIEARRGGEPGEPVLTDGGEVWVLDQGTDLVHVYDGDDDFAEVTTIDLRPHVLEAAGFTRPNGAATVPHMIEFDSQERYAFIASTAGGVTIVVDARTKQVTDVLATGAGSHMAAVTPDDSAVWVAVIGTPGRADTRSDPAGGDPLPALERKMVEIVVDLDAATPTFAIDRELRLADLLEPLEADNDWTYPSLSPVCHQYDPAGTEAWITLGPGWNQGALVVLDLASGELVDAAAYDPDLVKANCGVSVTDEQVLVNWSGKVTPDEDTLGEWYVIDPVTYDLLATREANGFDTHGLRLTPDGSTYWQVNRLSDEALLIDADSLEVVREIENVAVTPDILAFNPGGEYVYITQRGPTPRSGAIHAASGDEPGLRIVDTATGETLRVLVQPEVRSEAGVVLNDVHGVGVRTASADDVTPTATTASTTSADHTATVRTVAAQPAALDPPRPEPRALGFHCGLSPA